MLARKTSDLDELIGKRIESRRKVLGFSLKNFASRLGVSSQQLYKYEAGINRISASSLKEISDLLNVTLNHFFEVAGKNQRYENIDDLEINNLQSHFIKIPDKNARNTLVDVANAMSMLSIQVKASNEENHY